MKRIRPMSCLAVVCLSLAAPVWAHHSFAMFDRNQTRQIAGTVKEVELISPHGWLRLLVPSANGSQNEWSLELAGPGLLRRFGWRTDALHPGDRVVALIHPLRDGSYGGQLISLTLPNGQVLGRHPGAAF